MLLLAVAAADLKPSTSTWSAVAEMLGDGLTPSAVRFVSSSPFVKPEHSTDISKARSTTN